MSQRDSFVAALLFLALALAVVLIAGCSVVLIAGCSLDIINDNTNTIVIRIMPPEPPVAGCGAIALGATEAGPGSVMLAIDPAGSYTLLDGGTSLGPAADGQTVALLSGAHALQVTTGSCSSNIVSVLVP